jgi:hypothetical protein
MSTSSTYMTYIGIVGGKKDKKNKKQNFYSDSRVKLSKIPVYLDFVHDLLL